LREHPGELGVYPFYGGEDTRKELKKKGWGVRRYSVRGKEWKYPRVKRDRKMKN